MKIPILLAACGAILVASESAAQTNAIPIEGPRVIVDDKVVTEWDIRQQALDEELDPKNVQVRERMLRKLHEEARVSALGTKVALDDRSIRQMAEQMALVRERTYGSRAEFLEALRRNGQTYADYLEQRRRDARIDLLKRRMIFDVGDTGRLGTDLWVKPQAIRRYYREHPEEFARPASVRGRRILLSVRRFENLDEARESAKAHLGRIESGAITFEELAREVSDWNREGAGELSGDPTGELRWTDLAATTPWLPVEFVPRFGEASAGWIGSVETNEGVNLLQLVEKRPAGIAPFEDTEVQQSIEERLRERHLEKLQAGYLDRLEQQPYVWPPRFR